MGNRRNDPWGHGLEYLPKNYAIPCLECGTRTTGRHHVVPVSKGGKRQVPLCEDCHNKVHGTSINGKAISEGIKNAKANGKQIGAPKKVDDTMYERIRELRDDGLSYKKISLEVGLSVGTISNVCNAGT